jgi:uncharacterized membrane protein YdfJ with MMPL/SSD domain
MKISSFRKPTPSKALLLAGLFLLGQAAGRAETAAAPEGAPTRRIMPAVSPTPPAAPQPSSATPASVSPEDLAKAETAFRAQLEAARKKNDDDNASAMTRLNALDEKISALGKTGLDQGASLTDQKKDLTALRESQAASEKKFADSLKKAEEISENLERKGARMENLLDLMNTLKRDVNDNSHEIADMKGALEKIEARTHVKADDSDWWEQIVSWRYLPLAGALLGGIALGVAVSK